MKLSEVQFIVRFNRHFVKKLGIGLKQVAWFVKEAAGDCNVNMWEDNINAKPEDGMDCWEHQIIVETRTSRTPYVVEAIPYPRSGLILAIRGDRVSTPRPGDPNTIQMHWPDDFLDLLGKSDAELNITHIPTSVPDGQNRMRRNKTS